MKPSESNQTGMTWEGSGDRARQIMREYRGLERLRASTGRREEIPQRTRLGKDEGARCFQSAG